MGLKAPEVTARHTVSLEDVVPADDFYRHLDRVLDLAFVRDLVRDRYALAGRPSLDPVVFFRLQLILFVAGLRSERPLLRVVADRLSLRWYLGYDVGERSRPSCRRLFGDADADAAPAEDDGGEGAGYDLLPPWPQPGAEQGDRPYPDRNGPGDPAHR